MEEDRPQNQRDSDEDFEYDSDEQPAFLGMYFEFTTCFLQIPISLVSLKTHELSSFSVFSQWAPKQRVDSVHDFFAQIQVIGQTRFFQRFCETSSFLKAEKLRGLVRPVNIQPGTCCSRRSLSNPSFFLKFLRSFLFPHFSFSRLRFLRIF